MIAFVYLYLVDANTNISSIGFLSKIILPKTISSIGLTVFDFWIIHLFVSDEIEFLFAVFSHCLC